jgi:hypothetical protein
MVVFLRRSGIEFKSYLANLLIAQNLFVTFALSASHTAFSSIRMEPVFMVTSQSAATAAALAIDENVSVQRIDQTKLRARLVEDKQVLNFSAKNENADRQQTGHRRTKITSEGFKRK